MTKRSGYRLFTLWDGRPAIGWDLDGMRAFGFHHAPAGLATRRQLRADGLNPGRREPYALLVWRGGRRWAYLYRVDLARPRQTMTDRQAAAFERAQTARRTCRTCGTDAGHVLPTSTRQCADCWESCPVEVAA